MVSEMGDGRLTKCHVFFPSCGKSSTVQCLPCLVVLYRDEASAKPKPCHSPEITIGAARYCYMRHVCGETQRDGRDWFAARVEEERRCPRSGVEPNAHRRYAWCMCRQRRRAGRKEAMRAVGVAMPVVPLFAFVQPPRRPRPRKRCVRW